MKLNLISFLIIFTILLLSKSQNPNDDKENYIYTIEIDGFKSYPDICIKTGDMIKIKYIDDRLSASIIDNGVIKEKEKYHLLEGVKKGRAYIKVFKVVDLSYELATLCLIPNWKDYITIYVDDCYSGIKKFYYKVARKGYPFKEIKN